MRPDIETCQDIELLREECRRLDSLVQTYVGSSKEAMWFAFRAASALLGVTEDEIRLACGEITPDEMQAIKAVLEWRRQAILKKADEALE